MRKLLLLALAAAMASTAQAQTLTESARNNHAPYLVTVAGQGEATAANTTAVLELGFAAAGPTEPVVRQDLITRSQAVVTSLKKLPAVTHLQTTSVIIRPQISHHPEPNSKEPSPPTITGYTGQITVSFRTPVEDAGQIISDMMKAGANSVSQMYTQPSDEARKEAENEALSNAAQDALTQARTLHKALDLQWVGLRSVDAAGDNFSPRPMPRAAMMMAAESASPLPIEAGDTTISRTVVIQVEFQPINP